MEETEYQIVQLKGEVVQKDAKNEILELRAEDLHVFWISPINRDIVGDVKNLGKVIQWIVRDQKGRKITPLSSIKNWAYTYPIRLSKEVCGIHVYTLEAIFLENKSKRKIIPKPIKIRGYAPPLVTKIECGLPEDINDLGDYIEIDIQTEGLNGVKLCCEAELGKLKMNASNVCVDGKVKFKIEINKIGFYMLDKTNCNLTVKLKDPLQRNIKTIDGNELILHNNWIEDEEE